MKSGRSFFNPAVFRKDVTRFAPAWILYSILTLLLLLAFISEEIGVSFAAELSNTTPVMGFSAMCYAFLNVQLLFGDLFSSRMSNALHAMPIRRETWFGTHVVSGLAFALVPMAAFTGVFLLLCGNVWQVPLLWLGVSLLQYVFFFGVGVFSALCVGNRFAMVLVYGILNLLSWLLYWLISNIYQPLLYGIVISEDIFSLFCPMVHLIAEAYVQVDYEYVRGAAVLTDLSLGSGWLYLVVSAVVGVGVLVLALVLYRRRNLECAGDLIAVRWMAPVFLILYTFSAGACIHGFFSLFFGEESMGFVLLGLTIGFFTGLMLIERTVRVLRKRNILLFMGLVAAFVVTLVLTVLDPLGITRWVPEPSEVASIRISGYDTRYGKAEETDIQQIVDIHEDCVNNRRSDYRDVRLVGITIDYTLKTGIHAHREYEVPVDSKSGQLLRSLLSRPEAVLGEIYTDLEDLELVRIEYSGSDCYWETDEDINGLLDAIIRDCEAGVMAQDWAFIDGQVTDWINLECRMSNGVYFYQSVRFHEDCTNIIAWLKEKGCDPVKILTWAE